MLEEGSNMQFSNYHKQLETSFVIDAHIEYNLKEAHNINRYNADVSNLLNII